MNRPFQVLMLEGPPQGPEVLLEELENEGQPYEVHLDRDAEGILRPFNKYRPDVLMCDLARYRTERLFRDTVRTLVRVLESKDSYTLGHSERVTALAFRLAELLGVDQEHKRRLHLSGLMHDIGKVAVPDAILQKPGPLTQAEYSEVKNHVKTGCRIIKSIRNAGPIAYVVRHHHERWDGGGYPDGLCGRAIPLLSRILAVADAFDAMMSARPYRPALPDEKIVEELRGEKGRQFDPTIVDKLLTVYPDSDQFASHLSLIYRMRSGESGGT